MQAATTAGSADTQQPTAQRNFGYASIESRIGAFLIDFLIITVVCIFLAIIAIVIFGFDSLKGFAPFSEDGNMVLLLIAFVYFAFLESSSNRATPGKIAAGIKVGDESRSAQMSLRRSAVRTLAKIFLFPGIAYSYFNDRKQALHDKLAGSLVINRGESYLLLAFFMMLVPFTIIVGGFSYYVFSELSAQMVANKFEDANREYGIVAKENERDWTVITAAQLDEIMAAPPPEYAGPMTTTVGPFAIKLEEFIETPTEPKLRLRIKTSEIPNLSLGNFASVSIEHVISNNKQNIYDENSNFEAEVFRQVLFSKDLVESKVLSANRTVYLLPGSKKGDVLGISGSINLHLPVGTEIAEIPLSKNHLNEERKFNNDVEIRLMEIDGNKARLRYNGKTDKMLGVIAYNNKKQQIEIVKTSTSDAGDRITNYEYEFRVLPETIKVIVASEFISREYPFVLGKEFKKVKKPKE